MKNVGGLDAGIRIVLALVIFAVGYYYQSLWGFVGLVPLLTASISWCPLYTLLGIKTCSATSKTTT
jgi:hypothetical protein